MDSIIISLFVIRCSFFVFDVSKENKKNAQYPPSHRHINLR